LFVPFKIRVANTQCVPYFGVSFQMTRRIGLILISWRSGRRWKFLRVRVDWTVVPEHLSTFLLRGFHTKFITIMSMRMLAAITPSTSTDSFTFTHPGGLLSATHYTTVEVVGFETIPLAGIDVPFHSSFLVNGVVPFREIPTDAGPSGPVPFAPPTRGVRGTCRSFALFLETNRILQLISLNLSR
jgi:hypothetical protein